MRLAVVFVHGNPEVDAIWDAVVDLLDVDGVVRLSPPGFGSPIPDGFGCTLIEYRDWLIEALEALDVPSDVVGHDVGGSTTIAAVMERPDLFRTWASDSAGVFDEDYRWHDMAQAWQTPGVGERAIAEWTSGDETARLALAHGLGASGGVAAALAAGLTPTLDRAVLGFYRSARQPAMVDLGRSLERAAQVPGLVVLAEQDNFVGSVAMRERSARRAGATIAHIANAGHRWMLDQPADTATFLEQFWRRNSVG